MRDRRTSEGLRAAREEAPAAERNGHAPGSLPTPDDPPQTAEQENSADADHSGHAEWMRTVLARYERPLVRYAMRITGELHSARDAVQETLLRLVREERAKIEPHLAAWLYTVCRHRALDAKRKEKRMPTLDHDHVAERPAAGPTHEQAADDRDHCRQIGAVLATLSANQQEVVRLKFQEGLSYKEIAQVTELSVTNVGYLIHTAIAKLREKLGQSENEK